MSNCFNTDGLFTVPATNGPITTNALESIECTIAFDVRDWSEDRRSQWIYFIVFGIDNESWCLALTMNRGRILQRGLVGMTMTARELSPCTNNG